jgi:hypothetical protein
MVTAQGCRSASAAEMPRAEAGRGEPSTGDGEGAGAAVPWCGTSCGAGRRAREAHVQATVVKRGRGCGSGVVFLSERGGVLSSTLNYGGGRLV